MFEIRRYTEQCADEWNRFVAQSKNGTLLTDRRYMDYHSNRFEDHSLVCLLDGKLFALLPANSNGKTLYSHQGLTYGGLIMNETATAQSVCHLFSEIKQYLYEQGFYRLVYKPAPWIYHRLPAEEDLFALINIGDAKIIGRRAASVVSMNNPARWRRDRRYAANKAHTNGLTVEESDDLQTFWQVLDDNLEHKYNARPTHTLAEMQLLKQRFPTTIRLYTACDGTETVGGTIIYLTPRTAHAQYISATEKGKRLHAIDAIFDYLLRKNPPEVEYFDFGTSMAPDGHSLHESLIYQKEGFGARTVCYDTYEIKIQN